MPWTPRRSESWPRPRLILPNLEPTRYRCASMAAAPGKQSAVSNKTVNLSFTDEQLQQALRAGLIVDNTIPSPAQPARLRIVVEDKGSGSAGSVRVPLFLK